jgi:hypothetical protein
VISVIGDTLDRGIFRHQTAVRVQQHALLLPALHGLAHVLADEVAHVVGGGAETAALAQPSVIAGAGDVRYKGNPSVKQNIAGSGAVRKIE